MAALQAAVSSGLGNDRGKMTPEYLHWCIYGFGVMQQAQLGGVCSLLLPKGRHAPRVMHRKHFCKSGSSYLNGQIQTPVELVYCATNLGWLNVVVVDDDEFKFRGPILHSHFDVLAFISVKICIMLPSVKDATVILLLLLYYHVMIPRHSQMANSHSQSLQELFNPSLKCHHLWYETWQVHLKLPCQFGTENEVCLHL